MRSYIICTALLIALFARPTHAKPNIVFIYTDDQAPFAVNAAGDSRFITPNIDRIFDEGAHLKNSFVTTPVCSPSRVGLLTSRYGSEFGITDWINPGNEKQIGLPKDALTFSQLFQAAGYATGLFGKWHLGIQDQHHPTQFGYDFFAGIRVGGCPPKNPVMETLDGEIKKVEGYTCDIFTDHTIDFIRKNQDRPFLASLHFRAPHAAWLPVRPEDWEPFKDLDPEIPNPDYPKLNIERVKKQTREYLAAVKSIDRNVGRVLEVLNELELVDNTIIVFTSDHGYNLGEHGVWYKGNAIRILKENPKQRWPNIPASRRPNLWDTSLQVPTAIKWPKVIKPGTKHSQTFSNLDWFPTLLSMANLTLPNKAIIRGNDYSPILRGESSQWDDDIYLEYSMHHGAKTHMRGIRTPKWKFMVDFANPGRMELYDLNQDPSETKNLIQTANQEQDKLVRGFMNQITAEMQRINDPVLKELQQFEKHTGSKKE